ncbi:MAG TPA: GNAT family N-acetyltransferase [Novosphingobium sp.]|nr:GNAT family N-acetyltransferase [Novosphingobium sp.]
MFLRTERLLLRPAWPDDIDDFAALLAEEQAQADAYPFRLPDSVEKVRRVIALSHDRHLPHLLIDLPTDGRLTLIGGISLSPDRSEVELRYFIAPAWRGKGYATEAASALLGQAWMLGHSHVIATHFDGNSRAGDALARAGFRKTGETRLRYNASRGTASPALVRVAERPQAA